MANRRPRRVAGAPRRSHAGGTAEAHVRPVTDADSPHSPWPIRAAMIGAVATLLAALGGLFFSAETARQVGQAQASERFLRSVEQLGSDTIAVRVGAVYSFGHLMRDSRDDQQAVVEILSSFVRIQAAQQPRPPRGEETRPTPADILAALRVLDEQPRPLAHRTGAGPSIESSMLLESADLSGFQLSGIKMRQATLFGANLAGADLSSADLTATMLFGAKLTDADLSNADLTNASLDSADLRRVDLTEATLTRAGLGNVDLTGAVLVNADLSGAGLGGANLEGADLRGADITGAIGLQRARLVDITCSPTTRWPSDLDNPPTCRAPD